MRSSRASGALRLVAAVLVVVAMVAILWPVALLSLAEPPGWEGNYYRRLY